MPGYSSSSGANQLLSTDVGNVSWTAATGKARKSSPHKNFTTSIGASFRAGMSRTLGWNILSLNMQLFLGMSYNLLLHLRASHRPTRVLNVFCKLKTTAVFV